MINKSTKKHWTAYWKREDHQPLVTHDSLIHAIESRINLKEKKLLEVGAGMGGDSIYFAKKGAKVTLLDFTTEALQLIKKNAQKANVSISTIEADARKIPCKDNTFDVIFHQGFLEHFKDPLHMLLEQKRVLKKGGILVIDVPQRYTTYTIKKHIQMHQKRWFAGWERQFSIKELEKLTEKAGMHVVGSYGWGYYGKLYVIRHLNLGDWYETLWQKIESSRMKLYISWCIGVVAKK